MEGSTGILRALALCVQNAHSVILRPRPIRPTHHAIDAGSVDADHCLCPFASCSSMFSSPFPLTLDRDGVFVFSSSQPRFCLAAAAAAPPLTDLARAGVWVHPGLLC